MNLSEEQQKHIAQVAILLEELAEARIITPTQAAEAKEFLLKKMKK